jgi:hypothetical protein
MNKNKKLIISKDEKIGSTMPGVGKEHYDEIEIDSEQRITVHLHNLKIGKLTLRGQCVMHIYGTYIDKLESEEQCILVRHTTLPASTSKVKDYVNSKCRIEEDQHGLYSDTIDP